MDVLIIVLVITTLLNGVFLLAHYWLLARALDKQHAQVLQEIADFFHAPSETEPSKFAQLTDAIIERLSQRVVLQIKTTLMGVESVATRKAGQVAEAIMADSNPAAAALMGAFPSLGKILKKNPQVLNQLATATMKLPGFGGGGNGGSTAGAYNPRKFEG